MVYINSTLACILGLFMLAPIRPIETFIDNSSTEDRNAVIPNIIDSTFIKNESITTEPNKEIVEKVEEVKEVVDEPKATKSGYAKFYGDIDKGKKILCFFAPGCDHCQDAAKELTAMRKKDKNFPDVKIIFMNEEAFKIPEFFKIAGATYPYKVIEIIPFWNELGDNRNTPGILYLWNGNKIKMYDGIDANQFNGKALEKMVQQPYSKIK